MTFKSTSPVRNVNLPPLEEGATITFLSNSGLYGPTGEPLTLECYRCQDAFSGDACLTYLREIETEGGDSFENICTGCIRKDREEREELRKKANDWKRKAEKLRKKAIEDRPLPLPPKSEEVSDPSVVQARFHSLSAARAKQLAADILSCSLEMTVKKDEYLEAKYFSYSVSYAKVNSEEEEDHGYWLPGGWFHSMQDEEQAQDINDNPDDYNLLGDIEDLIHLTRDRGINLITDLEDCLNGHPMFQSHPETEDYSTGEDVTYTLHINHWGKLAFWVQELICKRIKEGR